MTPRTLFNIILKIIGILFFRDMITVIRELADVILYMRSSMIDSAILIFSSSAVTLGVYVAISYFLIFKSDLIIDTLKLDQGFEEERFSFNIHRSSILSIAIIVIGGVMIADGVPSICGQIFEYIQEKKEVYFEHTSRALPLVISLVKLVIGLILVFNQRQIVNAIELNRKK